MHSAMAILHAGADGLDAVRFVTSRWADEGNVLFRPDIDGAFRWEAPS